MRTSLVLLVMWAGCDTRETPRAHDVTTRPDLSAATQADLARELDDAERRGTWRAVRERWQGQHLHWTVIRHKALCASDAACNVSAFPVQRPAQHGWLPALSFAPGEFSKVAAGCGSEDPCKLVVEGTLGELTLNAEQPVSMRFEQVRIVKAG